MNTRPFTLVWLLVLPVVCWFYFGLFVTMWLWYPGGLAAPLFRDHLVNFSIIYVIWMIVFFVYTVLWIPPAGVYKFWKNHSNNSFWVYIPVCSKGDSAGNNAAGLDFGGLCINTNSGTNSLIPNRISAR